MLGHSEATVVPLVQNLYLFAPGPGRSQNIKVQVTREPVKIWQGLLRIADRPIIAQIQWERSSNGEAQRDARINGGIDSRGPPASGQSHHVEIGVSLPLDTMPLQVIKADGN